MYEQQWILKRAQLIPQQKALIEIETNRTWTYEQLPNEISKWHYFKTTHIQKGDRVCVITQNSIEHLQLCLHVAYQVLSLCTDQLSTK